MKKFLVNVIRKVKSEWTIVFIRKYGYLENRQIN